MFGRRLSVHGRRMGDLRSAQQKCIRRGMLEPLISLHLEHLLSEPDFSLAAMRRMQVIAAEDLGAGALGLVPALLELEEDWAHLDRKERAKRLIQASHLCTESEGSRFVPCWIVSLLQGVEIPEHPTQWRSLSALLGALEEALEAGALDGAGLLIEEIFLRHPIEKEDELPGPAGLPRDVMKQVWVRLEARAQWAHRPVVAALRQRFGSPSKESVGARLFLYLALVTVVLEPEVRCPALVRVSDDEVTKALQDAKSSFFPIPAWMNDRHTQAGRQQKLGYAHFFAEAALLTNPSDILGEAREEKAREEALAIYLAEEARYGRRASSSHMRRRWRAKAADTLGCTKASLSAQTAEPSTQHAYERSA